MKAKFELTKEQKNEMAKRIKGYFERERDEQIGDLAAQLILEFFIEELGPMFYNIAVEDCHTYMTEKLEDMFEIQKR
ncbi:DUF2164 family protein [Virgibacillus dakarensis]|uniref:DUF2164 domain-containing protein n=1 Tax=Lentibacillus populi TaxID=1827502 RepID=A0A9W5X5A4_9BACI|nr:DUF2164 domain-containing protein [Lentibacillus populi]MBT2218191.1 DUF2164 family protein [Virgibacillus dakarensis]MTW87963.1 DUF2164 family protein [Virgibacillus dakarensis]GGB37670.1 hypothetical protein GCM10011409_13910 [Lentibacillus populi]